MFGCALGMRIQIASPGPRTLHRFSPLPIWTTWRWHRCLKMRISMWRRSALAGDCPYLLGIGYGSSSSRTVTISGGWASAYLEGIPMIGGGTGMVLAMEISHRVEEAWKTLWRGGGGLVQQEG